MSDEEWALVALHRTFMREDAPQREHNLREVFNGPRRMDAGAHGIQLEVIKLPEARQGFVLLPRRRVVERSFA